MANITLALSIHGDEYNDESDEDYVILKYKQVSSVMFYLLFIKE